MKRQPTIVLCTPVYESVPPGYLTSVLLFKDWCMENGVRLVVSFGQDAVVGFARAKCLGASSIGGKNQIPWGGRMDYDWILWVDSDIAFRPEDVLQLIRDRKDVVSGLYRMNSSDEVWCAGSTDWDFFSEHGYMPRLGHRPEGLVRIDWCGMGFMLVRRGVFERIPYPWFAQRVIEYGSIREATSEDIGFCLRLQDAGFDIWADGRVVLNHIKPRPL